MSKLIAEYHPDILAKYLTHPDVTAVMPGEFNLLPALTTAIRLVASETYYSDKELADRWRVSVELLQKFRRIGRGPTYTRLSAGVIRHALIDVLHYEAQSRCVSNGGKSKS